MNRFIILILLFPLITFAQTKPTTKPLTGFTLNGNIKDAADGLIVELLNGQTGALELSTKIIKEKFVLKGKMNNPDFKLLIINKHQPPITLFLDNSNVTIWGSNSNLDKLNITGSQSHKDFAELNSLLTPYQNVFTEGAVYDSVARKKAQNVCYNFAVKHTNSYINPLAIYRFNQASEDITKTEFLYKSLNKKVKESTMGRAVEQLIVEGKKATGGIELPDFTQADTTGNMFTLSTLRGKYVLVDFWASWCRPCRQENPNVVQAYNKFKNKNFTIIGVSLDKAKQAWVDAINMDGLTWYHVSDLQGWSNAVAQQNQIFSIPQNFLLDPKGKIIARNLRGEALDRKLESLLK